MGQGCFLLHVIIGCLLACVGEQRIAKAAIKWAGGEIHGLLSELSVSFHCLECQASLAGLEEVVLRGMRLRLSNICIKLAF